jgi:hypothetical protein
MLKKIMLYAAVVTFALVGPSLAQTAHKSPANGNGHSALLTEIANWLSANFDLPAVEEHPRIEFAPPRKLVAIRYNGLLPEGWREDSIRDPAVLAAYSREVVAIYNDTTKTIFLPTGWTGASPAEVSVLVHEMVHHLQNLSGLKYDCPAGREKLAYKAQNEWLQQFGLDLQKAFEVDMLTLLVTTSCMN